MTLEANALNVEKMYLKETNTSFPYDLVTLLQNVVDQISTRMFPDSIREFDKVNISKSQYESCVITLRYKNGVLTSKRKVIISHLIEKEDTIAVVFVDNSRDIVSSSKTRHYQPMKHLGTQKDGSSRSHLYSTMVTRLPFEELPVHVMKYLHDGEFPEPFDQTKYVDFFVAVDKDRYKAVEGV